MENNQNNNQKPVISGIRPWGSSKKRQFNNDNELRLPFLKLKAGLNTVRLISDIGAYYQARYKKPDAKKGDYGDRVRTSYPQYEDCPVKNELGLTPKRRDMAIVIDRDDENTLKIFDMSTMVTEGVENQLLTKNAMRDKQHQPHVTPFDFDVAITFNPKGKKPADFYVVAAYDVTPLSEEDLALIKDAGGSEGIEKILSRQLICPKPETVRKRLADLGWDGKPVSKEDVKSESTEGTLETPEEDDYAFPKPAEESTDVPAVEAD